MSFLDAAYLACYWFLIVLVWFFIGSAYLLDRDCRVKHDVDDCEVSYVPKDY